MGKSIGILSIKGGVGKTSSVISLGDAISGFGKKVLLVDANFSSPNLGIHFKIIDPPNTLHDVLGRKSNFKEAIQKLENFDVLPATIFQNKRINPLDLRKKLRTIKGKYDVVLIDSSPALNEETLAAMVASDEIIIVTTPDHITLSTTLKAINFAKNRKTKINGIILNKVHGKRFELSLHEIEKATDVPILAVIPYDLNVLESVSKFIPSTSHKPKSPASKEYKKLAGTIVGERYKPVSLKNFFRLTPKKQEVNREVFYKGLFK
tara:strand:- start:155 stop:946 length:792 start_codon:yes stop_codon:yes gene_type:complete